MTTFTLLRLLLKEWQARNALAREILAELKTLNQTGIRLVMLQAVQANLHLPIDPAVTATTSPDQSSWLVKAPPEYPVVETVRERLLSQLGREPFEEELFRELELEIAGRAAAHPQNPLS